MRAADRPGLLRDITEAMARERLRVTASQTYARDGAATLFLTVEVRELDDLKRALPLIKRALNSPAQVRQTFAVRSAA